MKLHLPTILILLLALYVMPCQAKDKIMWMEAVAPPFFIHEGPLADQGYEDVLTDIIEENLPDYEHVRVQATISRHYQQWKQGEKACSVAMYKTAERMEFAYFSIPSCFTLPPGIIIRKENFEKFGGKKVINLTEILTEGKLVLGRARNRSYGVEMDKTLDDYGTENNIFTYEGPQLTLNLFKMLLAGRIDGLPSLPEEAMYLAETEGFKDQIMILAINENLVNYDAMITRVACSRTEWGKKTIDRINQVLTKQRPTNRFRAAYERWLDSNSLGEYRKLYQEVFLQTKE